MSEGTHGERFGGGRSGRVLVVVAAASMLFFYGQFVIPPLLPTITDDLGITPTLAGIALSLMWALIAVFRFPGGRLADRLSPKTVLAGSFAATAVGLVVLALASTYPAFLVGVAVVGIGVGLYVPAALSLLTETFVARRGRAFAVNEIAINLGGVSAGLLGAAVLAAATWHSAFPPALLGLLLVAALSHRWIDQPYVLERPTFDVRATGTRLVGDRRVLAILVAFTLFAFTWQGFANFLPTYLQVEKGFEPAIASNAFTGLFVVGIAANVVVTPLGDRFGLARTAAGASGLGAVGLAGIVVAGSTPGVLGGIVLFGLGTASFWPLLTAHFMGVLPETSMGGDYGAVSSIFMLVGSLGSTYVGVVAENASYSVAFGGLVCCLLVAALIVGWMAAQERP